MKYQERNTKSISIVKKILLYMNATGYKILNDIPSSGNVANFQRELFSSQLIVVYNLAIIKFIFNVHLNAIIIIAVFCFHNLSSIFFSKDIELINDDYYRYYNRIFYFVFLIYFITGTICCILFFNSRIGKG